MVGHNGARAAAVVCGLVLVLVAGASRAQTHTTGLAISKTCPPTATFGEEVTCTVTVENQDPDHGVNNLVVTNRVPFPGGSAVVVPGCASTLTASNGTSGSGPDFTSCDFQETMSFSCIGSTRTVTDQAEASGVDADTSPGGFGGLPVSSSTTNSIIVECPETPPATSAPLLSWLGAGCLLAGLVGTGVFRLRRRGSC